MGTFEEINAAEEAHLMSLTAAEAAGAVAAKG